MNIKFEAADGWRAEYNDFVVLKCLAENVIFIDRANVLRPTKDHDECQFIIDTTLSTKEAVEWFNKHDVYCAWFNHRGMEELPFDKVVKLPEES